jgi:DNA repair ATPase RecN
MKHVKLFEQFVTEARDSQIKSWAWDYYNTCEEIGQWERAVENQTVELDWLESIDSPSQKIQDAIDHKKASLKRAAKFVKKKTKKKMKLESEFEEIKDTSKDADKLKDMACAAGMATSGLPHFQDGLIEVMSNYGAPEESIKELEKITKEYQANLDKELKVGKKLKDEFEKFHASIK